MTTEPMSDLTAIVISFLRPAYTIACIETLREHYPGIKILVGENGEYEKELAKVCEKVGAKYIKLEYDSGVCQGRNSLMAHVETKYVLVGDDDFFYDEKTGVDKMRLLLESQEQIDLIGGRVRENGIVRNYQGSIDRKGRMIINRPIDVENAEYTSDAHSGLRWIKTDLVFNFFVARTERIKHIPWDDQIKVAYEHESWFIDLQKAGLFVAFSPEPIVEHKPMHLRDAVEKSAQHPTYKAFRMRRTDKERFFRRHKLDFVIDMNGNRDDAPYSPVERTRNDVKHVDFCITTFKRPEALERLLISIARYYPTANVYVADQNETLDREFYKRLRSDLFNMGLAKRVSVESLPYDCGLSYARNHLVTTTPNMYKLILDDDMEFSEETDIGKMIALFETNPKAGIVGGMVRQLGYDMHFEFTPEIEGDTIYHRTEVPNWKTHKEVKYRKTGCVLNFAVFKREVFNSIQWDRDLKVTEHTDFYLRLKNTGWQVLYTPDVVIEHPPVTRSQEYKDLRKRDQFMALMFRKHRAKRVIYENGQTFELMDDGSFSHYKQPPKKI